VGMGVSADWKRLDKGCELTAMCCVNLWYFWRGRVGSTPMTV
jgi:hypothetical protein